MANTLVDTFYNFPPPDLGTPWQVTHVWQTPDRRDEQLLLSHSKDTDTFPNTMRLLPMYEYYIIPNIICWYFVIREIVT